MQQVAKTVPFDSQLREAMTKMDWPLLVRRCRKALQKDARHLLAHRLLGFGLGKMRDIDGALSAYKRAAAIWPDDGELLINHANLLLEQGRFADAMPLLDKVCQQYADKAIVWIKLAQCCYSVGAHIKGIEAAEKAYEAADSLGDKVSAINLRAVHRRELGQVREAVDDCTESISLYPNDQTAHTNRLLFMLGDPSYAPGDVTQAAREFAAIFEDPLKATWPDFSNQRHDPWRRIRVGFISGDFRTHAVMHFVEGLLAQLDRRQFDVFAFHLYPSEDAVTLRVRHHVDHFIRLANHTVAEQYELIKKEEIDILIDLSGHTGHNGLQIMARKAAPVQVSWLGFPATTGLKAIDYKFTDEVADMPEHAYLYSERLYRLPTLHLCYRPMSRQPLWRYQPRYLVRPTPALKTGYVTFGSCNNLGKLTDETLSLWGRLLEAVPNAKLLIEGKGLGEEKLSRKYRERCASLGIDTDRLLLVPLAPANQYLTYHDIDIALDPFPYNGGTTSLDTLWMGVPLVSKVGGNFISRLGTAFLSYLGRTEWLAKDDDEYVRIASGLAANLYKLNALRLSLRQEVERSVLMREDLFCHHFGEGLRLMWLQWLAQGEYPKDLEAQSRLIESWLPDVPADWSGPPTPGVGLAPGRRVSLQEAHQQLQALLEKAQSTPAALTAADKKAGISHASWVDVTNLATLVLCAVPNDPVALSCLAEVEHAHGHTDFSVTYLRHAQEAIAVLAQAEQLTLAAA